MIRLQKWLAESGISSRRRAEELIISGRVSVNGVVVTALGTKANPLTDSVELDGKSVDIDSKKEYVMLNKPEGVVTTVTDPFGRNTVMDYIAADKRLFPVGRLDSDTSGLLLLTNDGEWAQKLMHPKYEVKKTYVAIVQGVPSPESLRMLRRGVVIDNKKTAPAEVILKEKIDAPIAPARRKKGAPKVMQNAKIVITIREGRNRQVRKMCDAIGHTVLKLKRVGIGSLVLGNLEKGKWRKLTARELKSM